MTNPQNEEFSIFVKWMEFLKWLLPVTEKFPKKIRFTFVNRIDNLAIELVEDLIEARYAKEKHSILKRADLRLEKLRILLRISHELGYLPHTSYEYATRSIHEVGKMLGGWIKYQEEK